MRTPVSYGYLRPKPAAVAPGPWFVTAGVFTAPSPESLPDWDYGTSIEVERLLVVDLPALLDGSGLNGGSTVRALLVWTSSRTRVKGAGQAVELVGGLNRLECRVPGEEAGGQLTLECRVVVGSVGSGSSPLAARRSGSTLWTDTHRIILEGSGSRFPTLPVPFSTSGLAGGRAGAWMLSVQSEDLSASAAGALCLYLNVEHPIVCRMLEQPEDAASRGLSAMVQYDVTRQLVALALEHEQGGQLDEYDAGSLGEALNNLLGRLYPDRPVNALRASRRSQPGEFEAELQARAGFLQ